MLKRIFILVFLFLACLVLATGYAQGSLPASKGTAPGEPADKLSWDFGEVREGEVAKHNFIIKNETSAELRIKDVSTSCGCAVSKIKKLIVKPGESAMVEVEFHSKGYSGKVKQHVYVNYESSDKLDNPVILRYIITANVVK